MEPGRDAWELLERVWMKGPHTIRLPAANGIFAWYGLTADWAVPSSTVTAWLGTTVVEVVAVVLVIVNYLFPNGRRGYA